MTLCAFSEQLATYEERSKFHRQLKKQAERLEIKIDMSTWQIDCRLHAPIRRSWTVIRKMQHSWGQRAGSCDHRNDTFFSTHLFLHPTSFRHMSLSSAAFCHPCLWCVLALLSLSRHPYCLSLSVRLMRSDSATQMCSSAPLPPLSLSLSLPLSISLTHTHTITHFHISPPFLFQWPPSPSVELCLTPRCLCCPLTTL